MLFPVLRAEGAAPATNRAPAQAFGLLLSGTNAAPILAQPSVVDYSLSSDSIIHLTMDNNVRIKAAKHKLESAEYNFKLFESRYTQFTPVAARYDGRGARLRKRLHGSYS